MMDTTDFMSVVLQFHPTAAGPLADETTDMKSVVSD
jgi:hypothetical protein